jgi:hypothetical protein
LIRAAIERLAIGGIERRVEIEPDHEVWVTDEGLAEGDEIGAGLSNGLVGALRLRVNGAMTMRFGSSSGPISMG